MPSRTATSHRSVSAKSLPGESVIDAQIDARIEDQIEQVDALFAAAGLTRSRREKPAGVRERARYQDKSPEDLRPAAAEPVRSSKGVEWVSAPGLKRIS